MVSQIQYDAPLKLFDTYLTGLNERQSNSDQLFNIIFGQVGQIFGVTLFLNPWKVYLFFNLRIKSLERIRWSHPAVFIVSFDHAL